VQKNLAHLYAQNNEVDNAIYWYEKAINNGCQEVQESLDNLLKATKNQYQK
jgi:hypothetical protein